MTNTPRCRIRTSRWLAIGLTITAPSLAATGDSDPIVATIGGEPISLSQVDDSGGRHLYDKAQVLYEARVQLLYALLSERLMTLEAQSRDMTVSELQQAEVTDRTPPVSDVTVENFILQQSNLDGTDPKVQRRVALFLRMQAAADRKTQFMQALFDEYGVSVTLAAPSTPPPEEIVGEFVPALGRPTAPVKIVTFTDYQCPYCRDMSTTLHQLHKRFPDTVQIVYRHFPLHPGAQQIAEAALCAEDQNRFWDYHAALYATPGISAGHAQGIAEDLNLDSKTFAACLAQQQHRLRVQQDMQEGKRLEITGTPTSFINGIRIHGAAKLPTLIAQVEALLSEDSSPIVIATGDQLGANSDN